MYTIKCIKGLLLESGISVLAGEQFEYTGDDQFESTQFSRNPNMFLFFTEEQLAEHFEMIT